MHVSYIVGLFYYCRVSEKVLKNLMDRIKSQREEWITSQSMMDVGEGQQQQFVQTTDSTG